MVVTTWQKLSSDVIQCTLATETSLSQYHYSFLIDLPFQVLFPVC